MPRNLLLCWIGLQTLFAVLAMGCPEFSMNDANDTRTKRWNVMEIGQFQHKDSFLTYELWPNRKIVYCFQDDEAEQALTGLVRSAWQLWEANGINGEELSMEQGDADTCRKDNKEKYLQVVLNHNAVFLTSVGKSIHSYMHLDPSDTAASGNAVANVAHEIGHAWGFFHEMQRKDLWSPAFGGTSKHDKFTWYCMNLADYSTVEQLSNREHSMEEICHDANLAHRYKLSASNFLPIQETQYGGNFDEMSLMMYGSSAGGKTVNGERAVTYTLKRGKHLHYNLAPSHEDVAKLKQMYLSDTGGSSEFETLYGSGSSERKGFRNFAREKLNNLKGRKMGCK